MFCVKECIEINQIKNNSPAPVINIYKYIVNGAKLAVASVARATPLFLPFPKIIYINVLHYFALPELICYVQHCLYAPIGAIGHSKAKQKHFL